jgi:hypothetical protein
MSLEVFGNEGDIGPEGTSPRKRPKSTCGKRICSGCFACVKCWLDSLSREATALPQLHCEQIGTRNGEKTQRLFPMIGR